MNGLPHDGDRNGALHALVADIAHLAGEQVVNLNGTVAFAGCDVLVVVVKAHAEGRHIDRTQGALGLDAEF